MAVDSAGLGGAAPPRGCDGLICAALVVGAFLAHALSPVTTSTDSAWTFHVAASILQEGNIDLDEYEGLMDFDQDYRLRRIGGHTYSYYPIATPLMSAPAVLAANLVLPLSRGEDFYSYLAEHAPDDRTARLEKLTASFIVALNAGLMYLVGRAMTGVGPSVIAAMVLVFATSMWSTASRALWQHGPSALTLTAALYTVIAARGRWWAALAAGLLLAIAYITRPTNSLSFAAFGVFHLVNNRRHFLAYAAGGAIILLPYAAMNWATFGNVLPPYSYQLFEKLGTPAVVADGMLATLVSPNRGLFVFSPVLLFAVHGFLTALRNHGSSPARLEPYLVAIIAGQWLITSLFADWHGAWSIGPRYLVEVLPYFVFLMIPFLSAWRIQQAWLQWAFGIALVASFLVQLRCSTSPYPFIWNSKPQALIDAHRRVWDWGDLQFLRGLCAHDPLEGGAPACWLPLNG